ncbi:hypothetical protein ACFPJ2_12445 [Microbacterium suwonense]|uniref:hypothetical protein n=1 Tax=Microbacterium suwonense TaxID=683047 RepID=UPI00360AA4C6
MADQKVPETPAPGEGLSAPASLQLLQGEAAAGVCVDGYCTLPSAGAARSASSD